MALSARKYTVKAKATRQLITANIKSTLLSIKKRTHPTGKRKEAQHNLKTLDSSPRNFD